MSFDNLSNRVTYTGNGTLATYAVPFPFFEDTDLVLELVNTDDQTTVLVLGNDYTVDVDNEEITLLTGNLSSGFLLTIRRVLPLTQETELRNQGPYFPETIEAAFDRQVMLAQQLQEQYDRSLYISSADEPVDMMLPIAALRAGRFLSFDNDGAPITAEGISSVPVSTFMATLLDDTTAAAGLTTLGFSAYFQTLISTASLSAFQTLLGMSTYFKTLLAATNAAAMQVLVGAPRTSANKTTNYTVLTSDNYLSFNCTSGNLVATLPAGAAGLEFEFRKSDSTFNYLRININGGSEFTRLHTEGEVVRLKWNVDSSAWNVMNRHIPSVWTAYTPTIGGGTGNTPISFAWRRDRQDIHIRGKGILGTPSASPASVPLPTGLEFEIASNAIYQMLAGTVGIQISGEIVLCPIAQTATEIRFGNTAQTCETAVDGSGVWGAGEFFHMNVRGQVAGWNG